MIPMWSLIMLASVALGYAIADLITPVLFDSLAVLAAGICIGINLTAWIFLLIRIFNRLTPGVGVFGLVLITVLTVIIRIIRAYTRNARRRTGKKVHWESVLLFIGACILFYLLDDQSYMDDGFNSAGTTFSDLPFHLGIISSMAYGTNSVGLKWQQPFYAGHRLAYPIIPDFYSAVLVACGGASLRVSICVPSIFQQVAFVVLLWSFARWLTKLRMVPELTVITWLLAGGVGWKWWFVPKYRGDINANFSHNFGGDRYTFWIAPLVHFLMPQRSGLFSIGLAVYVQWLVGYFVKDECRDLLALAGAGFVTGMLPMISAHSFVACCELSFFICVWNFRWKIAEFWSQVRRWVVFAVFALALGVPQGLWLLRDGRPSLMGIRWVWLETFPKKYWPWTGVRLWWETLGSLAGMALIHVPFGLTPSMRVLYVPALFVWCVSNFIRYQPGMMDNCKVFFAGWLVLAAVNVSDLVIRLLLAPAGFVRKVFRGLVLAATVLGYCFSGILTTRKSLGHQYGMYNEDERDVGIWVATNTNVQEVFLGGPWHGSSIMAVGGRIITLGYLGWVWSHGLEIGAREREHKRLVAAREDPKVFEPLGIHYAVRRDDDRKESYQWPRPDSSSLWMRVLSIKRMDIYKRLENA